jgi:hypothetical protein
MTGLLTVRVQAIGRVARSSRRSYKCVSRPEFAEEMTDIAASLSVARTLVHMVDAGAVHVETHEMNQVDRTRSFGWHILLNRAGQRDY